jgi:hypothetical protein
MRESMGGCPQPWLGFAFGVALSAIVVLPGLAEARPVRGPVMRVERRVARVQAMLERERERAQAPARPRVADARRDAATAGTAAVDRPRPASGTPTAAPPAAAAASGAHVAAPAKPPAASAPGVARAGYEAPVPTPASEAASRAPSVPGEPAADGTFSVLVQPQGAAPTSLPSAGGQAGEPLRFPDASTP